MAVKDIPATKEWCCDLCKHVATNPQRPNYWSNLHLQRDAYDFQGAAVADASVKRLFCGTCTDKIVAAVNSVKP